jgi:hypothetical protein
VRKNGNKKRLHLSYLLTSRKPVDESVRREVLYNVLIEFSIPLKLARPVNMWLNETCSRVKVAKHVSDMFPIKGDAFHICFRVGL